MNRHVAIQEVGFAIYPAVFSGDLVDHLLRDLEGLAAIRSRAGVRHALRFAPVERVARTAEMMDLAREVLGPHAFPFRATLLDKSPDSNWLVVWHQDTALPLQTRLNLPGWGPWSVKEGIDYAHAPADALHQVLALRVSLDDSTLDNGPLRVLPKTHTIGVLSDDRIHELSQTIAPVECACPKGGIVAMKPLTVHASSKSASEGPRRVLHIEYAASASIAEPLQLAIA